MAQDDSPPPAGPCILLGFYLNDLVAVGLFESATAATAAICRSTTLPVASYRLITPPMNRHFTRTDPPHEWLLQPGQNGEPVPADGGWSYSVPRLWPKDHTVSCEDVRRLSEPTHDIPGHVDHAAKLDSDVI